MFTTAEVMAGFVVLSGLSLSGRLGNTVSEMNFAETAGWHVYSLIDKAGSWMFWYGIGLFLVGFTIGSAILPALFMRIAAIGYLLALAASLPVVVAFAWRTIHLKQVPFFLGTIAGLVIAILSTGLDFLTSDDVVDDSENEDDYAMLHKRGGAFFNHRTCEMDDGYDLCGIYDE